MGKLDKDEKNENVNKFLNSLKKSHRKSMMGEQKPRRSGGSGKNVPPNSAKLAVPHVNGRGGSGGGSPGGSATRRLSNRRQSAARPKRSSGSVLSGSSGGSSGGGSDGSLTKRRKHRRTKRKDKKDTLLSRIRDIIAESDVFVAHNADSPHLICILISYKSVLPFFILFVWDLLAVLVFEIPHLSTNNFPGFIIIFQFVAILLAMYGYAVQFVTTGSSSRYVTMAKFALIGQYILFGGRAAMEFLFEGFRYQEQNYVPVPWSLFPKENK